MSRPAPGFVGERRHGAFELRERLRGEAEVALQGGGDGRQIGFGALALELGFDFVGGRPSDVAGDDRERVQRELGHRVAVLCEGAQHAGLADLDERPQRSFAGRGQDLLAGLAGGPARRQVGRCAGRQVDLPLRAAVDGAAGSSGALRAAVCFAAAERAAASFDGDDHAVAAVAAPADQAGGLQGAVVCVEVDVGHLGDLATGPPGSRRARRVGRAARGRRRRAR